MIEKYIQPLISTEEINQICHEYIINTQNAIPASLNYKGFPKSVCISVNDVACHGISSYNQKLKNGDILNIDVTIFKNGFYGDTSKMFIVGKTNIIANNLCKVTQQSLYLAIYLIKPGIKINILGKYINNYIKKNHFSIVKEYCGHGINNKLHTKPYILHYYNKNNKVILKPGMVFTIEPIVNEGTRYIKIMKDKWTVKTRDKKLSAQYEHTILVTNYGCEILTIRKEEKIQKKIFYSSKNKNKII